MKAEVIEGTSFKPITLVITIQDEDELMSLWHKFNCCDYTEYLSRNGYKKEYLVSTYKAWKQIDNMVKLNNLKEQL